jgi:glycosyltransferase involved in cell wall biosynthesis
MKVSVYLPTRNRLELLQRAVRSVLEQSHQDFELIVVNDASTDGTRAYLDALAAADARVIVVHNETPGGAPAARNKAILRSTGDFVTGLDDDDYFHPERLKSLLAYWDLLGRTGERFSCLYTQDVVIGRGPAFTTRRAGSVSVEQMFTANLVGNQIFAPRQTYIDAGLFDEEMPAWQDLDFYVRVLMTHGPGRLLDAGLYYFLDAPRPDRITKASREKIMAAYLRMSAKYADQPPALRQRLFLQMFSRVYGLRPRLRDVAHFFSLGFDPMSWLKMVALLLGVRRPMGR